MPDVWGTLLERNLQFIQSRRIYNSLKERDPICAWTNGIANTSPQAIELIPSCSGQAHCNTPGSGYGYENTEFGCILAVIRVALIVFSLRSADAKFGKVV